VGGDFPTRFQGGKQYDGGEHSGGKPTDNLHIHEEWEKKKKREKVGGISDSAG
jgi:hypothetical protein